MRRRLLMNQFHVSVFVPPGLTPIENRRLRRTCHGAAFRRALMRAIQMVQRRYPSLQKAKIILSN